MSTPFARTETLPGLRVHGRHALAGQLPRLGAYVAGKGQMPLSRHPAWLTVLHRALGHEPYCLESVAAEGPRGFLPLAYVRSLLFGRYLVSLPYLNYGGALADDDRTASLLIDGAVRLADRLNVRHLELRHERPLEHPRLAERMTAKVHMRLELPATAEECWRRLSAKVRNQVRKGRSNHPRVSWGGEELLAPFYEVFSHNMRDLGTPVYGRALFREALRQFPDRAELCVVWAGDRPCAAALLLHGWGVTEVPSASSLRRYNPTCGNMLMYWHLLERAVQRRQAVFDFGRSTLDSSAHQFKKQWGAEPFGAEWQYYVRAGSAGAMRPERSCFQRLSRLWRRLPVRLTRLLGPAIVSGIP